MEPHIILLMNHEKDFFGGISPERLIACDEDGDAIIFDDFESARAYHEKYSVDGRIVDLPIY
jgi:hypothetical protein